MGATLQIADEQAARTRSADRGTYLATTARGDLEILVEGDTELLNVYHVIDIDPEGGRARQRGGRQGVRRLARLAGAQDDDRRRSASSEFGEPLFVPDAGKTDDADPGGRLRWT